MTNYDLLAAMNAIPEEAILRTGQLLENEEKRNVIKMKKIWRTVLIAAAITCLLSVTAYAVTQFTVSSHRPAAGEHYTAQYGNVSREVPTEYVFTFEGPEECPEVQFKANWAPSPDYWGFVGPGADGWSSLLEANELYNETYRCYQPACVVDVMYAPQFVNGGAMILSGWTPGPITEETWGAVQAYKFQATATHPMNPEGTVYATGNFVILFHPEEGWIIGVRGYDSMESIEGIARGIEVRQTGRTVRSTDFGGKLADCDIYIG
ncbi:MAG: hypothetical protein IJ594_02425 [Oscillospiraceae bacterium]|nr:hypothetical protein [Oscillospiraceae bacterium]